MSVPLTRVEMAAIIDSGTPVVFNGVLYTDSADLPTQAEIDAIYAADSTGPQGPQGIKGDKGDTGDAGAPGADGVDGAIATVNGDAGPDVVLDTDDISEGTNKYVTAAEKTKLSNLSGTNTGDQNLSAYALDASLNASNLTSGTVPDARFPSVLPAISGANLTNLPASGTVIDTQSFTASGTWTKPVGATHVFVRIWGSGGGGAGGGKNTTGQTRRGGTGGTGGAFIEKWFRAADLGSTVSVTINAGGSGGLGATANGNGANGSAGSATTFGSLLSAGAGNGGLANGTGVIGGSLYSAGEGSFYVSSPGSSTSDAFGIFGAGVVSSQARSAENGGGASGATANESDNTHGGSSIRGGAGGGGGGYIPTTNTATIPGQGGSSGTLTIGGGGAAGTSGSAGTAGTGGSAFQGGGGGGASTSSNVGGAGGAGGVAAGGGGGGGATNAGDGGDGGHGGTGLAIVISF